LFEGGLTLAKLGEARARLREMQARGGQVELDIALEVRQAALALEEAFEKIQVQEERRNWARQALEEVRHQYRNEVAGVDSLLQAQVAWAQAEAACSAAHFEGSIARALLRQSLGDFAEGIL
ncbi:MAG: TolC family protein, partial [Syntrophobacteraceae bacterium]|nr:TolC family protein [Syntrophobacteraceae bacterium]